MKATHGGHCQACGNIQKLPKGALSLHGYTNTHGFFSGICRGARYQPFEQATDQIERYIHQAQEHRAQLIARQQEIRQPVSSGQAWVSYHKHFRDEHKWIQVTIQRTINFQTDEHIFYNFFYEHDGKRMSIQHYEVRGMDATVDTACAVLNDKFAASFDREIADLSRYIVWQSKRVREWQLMPLLPLTVHKDNDGFTAFA